MKFTERGPIESGFAKRFDDDIAPELVRIEEQRKALLQKAKKHAGIPLVIATLLALLILWSTEKLTPGLFGAGIVLVVGGLAVLGLWNRQAKKWRGAVAETVMPTVCDFLGDLEYDKAARKRFPLDRIQGLGLIGKFTSSRLEDRIEGTYRDTEFEMVEATLRHESRDSDGDSRTKTVFKGLLIRIGVPQPVTTDILITRELGSIGNKLGEMFSFGTGRSMPRVEFDHDDFEAAFAVYADDPDAARSTMPAPFLDSLLAIAEEEGGKKGARAMTAGFQESSFYLALSRDEDFMEMGSLTTPVREIEEDLHGVFHDLAVIRRIIDRLHGDAPTG